MSADDDGPISRREVAWRLFAAEFEDADFEYSEADEERAPNYVITPTGARVNRLFVVGVLTEVDEVSDGILRGRVVDPTGPFVVYAGQYQPDAKAFLQGANPPSFVAVTGKARTFQPDDSDVIYTSIRPESINEVDAATRDRWAVQTAEHTLHRVSVFDDALATGETGDALEQVLLSRGVDPDLAAGIPLALEHYGTTRAYLASVHDIALDAARVTAEEIDTDEVGPLSLAPNEGGQDVSLDLDYALGESDYNRGTTEAEGAGSPAPSAETEPISETTDDEATDEEVTATESEPEPEAPTEEIPETETPEAETAETETPEVTDAEEAAELGVPTDSEPEVQPEQETTTEEEFEPEEDTEGELGTDEAAGEMYELDEEERAEIEENFSTEFSTGSEIGEPGEAEIEPEGAEPGAGDVADEIGDVDVTESDEELPDVEPSETEAPQEESTVEDEELDEIAEEVEADETEADEAPDEAETEPTAEDTDTESQESPEDLDEALMDVMRELNEGEGVHRDDLEAAMADRFGASAEAVGDALDEALMGGQCYESGADTFTPI